MSIKKQEASRRKLPLTFSLLLILAYFHLSHTEHWHTQAHINHVSVSLGVTHQGQLNPVISYLCAILRYTEFDFGEAYCMSRGAPVKRIHDEVLQILCKLTIHFCTNLS